MSSSDWIAIAAILVGAGVGMAGLIAGSRSSTREHETARNALDLASKSFDYEYSPQITVRAEKAFRPGDDEIEEYLHVKILNEGRLRVVIEYLVVMVFHADGQFSGYRLISDLLHNGEESGLPCPLEPHDKLEAPVDLPSLATMLHQFLLHDGDEFAVRAIDRLGRSHDSDRQSSMEFIAKSGVTPLPEERGERIRHRREFEEFLESQASENSVSPH